LVGVLFQGGGGAGGPVQINATEDAGVARLQDSGTDAVPVHAGRE
jgi:hypothetical protein